jgi:heat shock protein HslJ
MKTRILLSLCIIALVFTSCDETKKVIDTAGSVQLSGSYVVETIDGAATGATNIVITFAALDKSVRGNTGCNSFFGNYTLDLYALVFNDIGATEMACEEPIHTKEQRFLAAIYDTGSYTYDKGMLTLFSKTDRSQILTAKKEKNEEN